MRAALAMPSSTPAARHALRRQAVGAGVVCGLVALAVYAATCSRGVEWQDPAVHQYRILTGVLEHPRGLALSHPLHYWLGRAALRLLSPVPEPALRLNLMSAVCGAVGVGLLAGLLAALTRRRTPAYLAAAVLLVSHSFWQMSALTETYTLAGAMLALEWCLLLAYVRTGRPAWLVAVFAVNGLHVANHLLGLLSLVTYAGLAAERVGHRRLKWGWLPACAVVWAIAAAPYWSLAVTFYQQTGNLGATLYSAFFGGRAVGEGWAGDVLNTRLSAAQLTLAGLTLGYNFPSLAVPIAIYGLWRGGRGEERIFRRVLLAQTAVFAAFILRYSITDLYTYFVPMCLLIALWFGLGADGLLRAWGRPARRWLVPVLAVNAVLPVLVYVGFPIVAREHGWMRSRMRHIPYRDEYAAFFRPWRFTDHSAAVFSDAALLATGPGGWLLGEGTTAYTAAYTYAVHGGPNGVRVLSERQCLTTPGWPLLSDEALAAFLDRGGRAVVVPSTRLEHLWGEWFDLDRSAEFWQIRPRRSVQSPPNGINLYQPDEKAQGGSPGGNPP